MIKKNIDKNDNLKNAEGIEVSSIDYVKQCKNILTESNACKNLSNNILKVVLKMSQELNSKTEQIKAMTENINKRNTLQTRQDLRKTRKALVQRSYSG